MEPHNPWQVLGLALVAIQSFAPTAPRWPRHIPGWSCSTKAFPEDNSPKQGCCLLCTALSRIFSLPFSFTAGCQASINTCDKIILTDSGGFVLLVFSLELCLMGDPELLTCCARFKGILDCLTDMTACKEWKHQMSPSKGTLGRARGSNATKFLPSPRRQHHTGILCALHSQHTSPLLSQAQAAQECRPSSLAVP